VSARLDCVLVSPGNRRRIYQGLADDLAAIEPPVWAGLMATYLRRAGRAVEIVDAAGEGLSPEEVGRRIAERRPRLCAIVVYGQQPSASTQVMPGARECARAIREASPETKVALVGGHVAALPERTLREEPCDFVAGGEGLATLAGLLEAWDGAGPDLARVPGLHYRDGDALRAGPAAPLVADLDHSLPGLAWDLLPVARYRAHNWHCLDGGPRAPYAALYTTLGCPYRCTFCCIQAPFRAGEAAAGQRANSYRKWSADHVAGEIARLAEREGVRNVKLADEMFVLDEDHVLAVCDSLARRRLDLNVWAYARVDTLRPGMAERLRAAGVRWLAFGIESADAGVRRGVAKGFRQDAISRALEETRKAGIHVIANYIFGLPDDDLASMEATLALAQELNTEFANFYCAMAYPGSPLYEEARARGWALPESWSGYSQHAEDTLPLPTRHLSAGEVLRFRDRAFQAYFTSPRYLSMLEQHFGAAAADEVRAMAARPLARRHAAS
jgi:radical SAM superfamily enzyme YgiQ (UPF0313 family)